MTWLSAIKTILYWSLVPVITIFRWLATALAPLVHLGQFWLYAALFPVRLLAKFETLYIYFGVAILIGLLSGSILHLSSTVLVSLFNLASPPPEPGRSAASFRVAQQEKKMEDAWQSSSSRGERVVNDPALEKRYTEWLENQTGKRKEKGLLRQTILEEDDSSEDAF